jgi:hypothetical protein
MSVRLGSSALEIVSPFSEHLRNELWVTLRNDHRSFPVIRFVHRLTQHLLEGALELILSVDDLLSEDIRYLFTSFVYLVPTQFVRNQVQ